MPDDLKPESNEPETKTEETTEEVVEVEETDEQKPEEAEAGETKDEGSDELPEWAREKLTKANAEAANYRVRAREAEEKLKSAKSLEEVDAIIKEMTGAREQAERALLIENVALKYELPAKLQNRLVGNTREELEADAKELAAEFATKKHVEVHLEGGLSPRDRDSDPSDPRALARQYGGRKRR